MPLFIQPGSLCASKNQPKSLVPNGKQDLAHVQFHPGPMCATYTQETKKSFAANTRSLLPLQSATSQMCRKADYQQLTADVKEDGDVVLVAVIVGGFTRSNPFGHVAIAVEGFGTFSFGTDTAPGTGLSNYLAKQATYRSSTIYTIETTKARAQLIAARAQSFVGKKLPDPTSDPKGFADTCATRTIKALEAGGYRNPKPTLFGAAPSMFPRDAENYGREYGTSFQLKKGDTVPDTFKKFQRKE